MKQFTPECDRIVEALTSTNDAQDVLHALANIDSRHLAIMAKMICQILLERIDTEKE
jgi:hypothetical protein